jgi:hypothetical protein
MCGVLQRGEGAWAQGRVVGSEKGEELSDAE